MSLNPSNLKDAEIIQLEATRAFYVATVERLEKEISKLRTSKDDYQQLRALMVRDEANRRWYIWDHDIAFYDVVLK